MYGYGYSRRNRGPGSRRTSSASRPTWPTTGCWSARTTWSWRKWSASSSSSARSPRWPGSGGMTRVLNVMPGENTAEFLKQLERSWKSLAPNPLILARGATGAHGRHPADEAKPAASEPPQSRLRRDARSQHQPLPHGTAPQPARPRSTTRRCSSSRATRPRRAGPPNNQPSQCRRTSTVPGSGPPGSPDARTARHPRRSWCRVGPDGRLVVSSNDVEALAMFEELAVAHRAAGERLSHLPLEERLGHLDRAEPRGVL